MFTSNGLEKSLTLLFQRKSTLFQLHGPFLIFELNVFLVICGSVWFNVLKSLFVLDSPLFFIKWNILMTNYFTYFWKCLATVISKLFCSSFIVGGRLTVFRHHLYFLNLFINLFRPCSIVHPGNKIAQELVFGHALICGRGNIDTKDISFRCNIFISSTLLIFRIFSCSISGFLSCQARFSNLYILIHKIRFPCLRKVLYLDPLFCFISMAKTASKTFPY